MQRLILAATLCAGLGLFMDAATDAANASSIKQFKPTSSSRTSIVEIGCVSCSKAAKKAATEDAVQLAPGEQIVEIRDVGGEKMIYRTESWLGGSPVVMVRKANQADLIALGVVETDSSKIAELDKAENSEAVKLQAAAPQAAQPVTEPAMIAPALVEPVVAITAIPDIDTETTTSALSDKPEKAFDPSTFELRF